MLSAGNASNNNPSSSLATAGQVSIGQTSADPTSQTISQDCTLASTGAITCTKTNNVSFGALATTVPGTGVATFAATPTSANLAAALTDEVSAAGVSGKALFGTAGNLPATATNDSPAAGNVGEYVESVVASGSAVALTTATGKDVTTISLTAGDWDVDGCTYYSAAGTTSVTAILSGFSLSANTVDGTPGRFNQLTMPANVPGAFADSQCFPPYRQSLSGTTTLHLLAFSNFTVSTMSAYGIIRARRAR